MLSKNKGQVLSRNDFRGDQRIQGSDLLDIRQNNNKRPWQENSVHLNSRNNINTEANPSKAPVASSSSSTTSGGSQIRNSNFTSLKPQPDQTPSSSSDGSIMASVGNDPRKENKRTSSSKGVFLLMMIDIIVNAHNWVNIAY